jgi:hypothetical protein
MIFAKKVETRLVLKLCRAEACKVGSRHFIAAPESQNRVKVEAAPLPWPVFAIGPAAMADNNVYARLDSEFNMLLETM